MNVIALSKNVIPNGTGKQMIQKCFSEPTFSDIFKYLKFFKASFSGFIKAFPLNFAQVWLITLLMDMKVSKYIFVLILNNKSILLTLKHDNHIYF